MLRHAAPINSLLVYREMLPSSGACSMELGENKFYTAVYAPDAANGILEQNATGTEAAPSLSEAKTNENEASVHAEVIISSVRFSLSLSAE